MALLRATSPACAGMLDADGHVSALREAQQRCLDAPANNYW
jgi:hypothetical protein